MSFKKRQLILATLVLALGAAIYLNWQFSEDPKFLETSGITKSKELGEAQYVNNNQTPNDKKENKEDKDKDKKEEKPKNASEYFSKAKLTRQKARDEVTEMFKGILEDVNSNDQAKQEAVKQAGIIAKNIQQESNIENLIKAKGFEECLVFINGEECNVVVSGGNLKEESAIIIKDIVSGQGGISLDKIKIVEAK